MEISTRGLNLLCHHFFVLLRVPSCCSSSCAPTSSTVIPAASASVAHISRPGSALESTLSMSQPLPSMPPGAVAVDASSSSTWDRISSWVSENKAVVYTIAGVAVVVTGAGVVYYLNSDSVRFAHCLHNIEGLFWGCDARLGMTTYGSHSCAAVVAELGRGKTTRIAWRGR